MRRLGKKKREKLIAYGKGTISLFLIILLTPFMFVAVMLAEGQKVTSSTSIIDEAMGVTSTSVLADYDKYLLDRWGLMAVSQDIDINKEYKQTLEANLGVLGKTLEVQKVNAKGSAGLTLDDTEILKRQVLEFCKYNAPVKLVNETLNLTQLLSSLESIGNFKQIADLISGTAGAVESISDLCKAAKELSTKAKELQKAKSKFESSYDAFEKAVDNYTSKCAEVEQLKSDEGRLSTESETTAASVEAAERKIQELQDSIVDLDPVNDAAEIELINDQIKELVEDLGDLRDGQTSAQKNYRITVAKREEAEQQLQALKQKAEAKRSEYAEAIGALSRALVAYEEKYNECSEGVSKIAKKTASAIGDYQKVDLAKKADEIQEQNGVIQDLKKEKKTHTEEYEKAIDRATQLNNELADQSMKNDIVDVTEEAAKEIEDAWSKVESKRNSETIDRGVDALAELKERVGLCTIESYTNPRDYACPNISGFASKNDIEDFIKAQQDELLDEQFQNLVKGLTDFVDALFDVDLFFDGTLSAFIDADMYSSNYGGLLQGTEGDLIHEEGVTVLTLMGDLGEIVKMVKHKDLIEYVPVVNIPAKFAKLAKTLKKCSEFFNHLVQFGKSIAVRVYEKLICSSYMAYNLPCRIDVKDTATNRFTYKMMTGYDMNQAGLPSQNGGGLDAVEDLSALVNWIKSAGKSSGNDITFSGAELEYVLFGSNSEVSNQLYVFVAFMLCRLVTTIPTVLTNADAQLMAGAATIGYGVVMVLLIIGETFIDTLLLVNGADLDFYEKTIHLSPSGVQKLVEDVAAIGGKKASLALKEKVDSNKRIMEHLFEEHQGSEKYQELKPKLDSDPYKAKSKVERARSSYTKSLGKFNYRDFCLMLLLITVPEHQQMARLRNLIQMESLNYYSTISPKKSTFDIRDTYVALDATADVRISWSLPSVTGSSWLTASRHLVRGY